MPTARITVDCQKDLKKLPKHIAKSFFDKITDLSPRFPTNDPQVKKLKKPLTGFRLRISHWRFTFFIENGTVYFDSAKHRSRVYKK